MTPETSSSAGASPEHDLADRLVAFGREIAARGWVAGSGGNLSARAGGRVLLKVSGVRFRQADRSSYVTVDLESGTPLEPGRRPSVECPMHLAIYRRRDDVGAVLHCHPPLSIAWAATGEPLRACTPDAACLLGSEVPVAPYAAPGSHALADAVAGILARGHDAVLLANHGIVTVGHALDEAFDRACALDAAVTSTVFARLLGHGLRALTPAERSAIRESVAAPGARGQRPA